MAIGLGAAGWIVTHPGPRGFDLNDNPLGNALWSAAFILAALRFAPAVRENRLVTVLNARALTVYLWHVPLLVVITHAGEDAGWPIRGPLGNGWRLVVVSAWWPRWCWPSAGWRTSRPGAGRCWCRGMSYPRARMGNMTSTPAQVRRTYYVLGFGNTLAASLIWGVNTIFLLDAGLNNFQAFAANAFFTAGMVLFEVPTGVVADSWGRRASYLLGTVTLAVTTAIYVWLWYVDGPFWAWAVSSVLIGLGFTFFSGATEAWLVDALHATGYDGPLDAVFARAQVFGGVGMLLGAGGGGYLAQWLGLSAPYLLRAGVLVLMFVVAAMLMRDLGFTPDRGRGPVSEIKRIVGQSVRVRAEGPPGALADGGRPVHRRHHHLRRLRACSRTCWICGATRRRTGSPGWPPRCWPPPRSSAAWSPRGSGRCSGAAPT